MIQKQYWKNRIICGGCNIRSAPLLNCKQPLMVIKFRSFGTTHWCHLQYPNNPRSPNIT